MESVLFTRNAEMLYNTSYEDLIGGHSMPVSKKQQASVHKYVKEHYDRISVTVPQGKKDKIRDHAEAQGESINGFINRAIDEQMERDKKDQE